MGDSAEDSAAPADSGPPADSGDSGPASVCPADMAAVGTVCMDLYEAPNRAGAPPLVMYSFDEAEDWCQARGKRLCLDEEWEQACAGDGENEYPYGHEHQPGVCNDEETWLTYSQTSLNYWPSDASSPGIESLEELFAAASTGSGAIAAEHVAELYQGEGGGDNAGCVGAAGVFDLVGNAEEWTRRADGGTTSFHGNLKGRYWAESRTCQSGVTSHGDSFRFYEIGFRCCSELAG